MTGTRGKQPFAECSHKGWFLTEMSHAATVQHWRVNCAQQLSHEARHSSLFCLVETPGWQPKVFPWQFNSLRQSLGNSKGRSHSWLTPELFTFLWLISFSVSFSEPHRVAATLNTSLPSDAKENSPTSLFWLCIPPSFLSHWSESHPHHNPISATDRQTSSHTGIEGAVNTQTSSPVESTTGWFISSRWSEFGRLQIKRFRDHTGWTTSKFTAHHPLGWSRNSLWGNFIYY